MDKIFWTDIQPEVRGNQHQCDMLSGDTGLKSRAAKYVTSVRDAFELFFSAAMMDLVVESTNLKTERTLSKLPQSALNDNTRLYLCSTDKYELYALFGLMYFRVLLGLNNHAVDHIFSEQIGHPVFAGWNYV